MLGRIDPSSAEGGASKEAGPSSSAIGEAAIGLVGVGVDDVVTVVSGVKPGEGRGKAGSSSLNPGLLGEGSWGEGERAREA